MSDLQFQSVAPQPQPLPTPNWTVQPSPTQVNGPQAPPDLAKIYHYPSSVGALEQPLFTRPIDSLPSTFTFDQLPQSFKDLITTGTTELAKFPHAVRMEAFDQAIGQASDLIRIVQPRVEALQARVAFGLDDLPLAEQLSLFGQLNSERGRLALAEATHDLSSAAREGAERSMRWIATPVSSLFAVDGLLSAERTARALSQQGKAEEAWRVTMQGAGRFVVDAGMAAIDGVAKLTGLQSVGIDVATKAVSDKLMATAADKTFDAINREAHWLAEQGWWPSSLQPSTPREGGSEGSLLGAFQNGITVLGDAAYGAAESTNDLVGAAYDFGGDVIGGLSDAGTSIIDWAGSFLE